MARFKKSVFFLFFTFFLFHGGSKLSLTYSVFVQAYSAV